MNLPHVTILDYNRDKILKTRTECFHLMELNIFKICNVLHAASGLLKLKEEIKLVIFYGEESLYKKHQSDLRFVFKDYFTNVRIQVKKVIL
jgi:hypothetical protein